MQGAKYKILNKFRASSIALGKDYSSNYMQDKGIELYIYNDSLSKSVITFKAFIESFSINFGVVFEEETEAGGASGKPKDFSCEYKVKLNVPSISVNDSRLNAARFEELNIMIAPHTRLDSTNTRQQQNTNLRVLLSNLIHNGNYKKQHDINNADLVRKYGLRCNIKSLSFEGDPEMGFFEYKNKLFFKNYSFNLDLMVFFTKDQEINKKRYAAGFDSENGSYDEDDIKSWPFGVL